MFSGGPFSSLLLAGHIHVWEHLGAPTKVWHVCTAVSFLNITTYVRFQASNKGGGGGGRKRENSNSNSKTLLYKACSLDSAKFLSNN